MLRKVSVLGSTGSIGKQALEVIESLSGKFEIYGLASGNNISLLKEQIHKFSPKVVSVKDKNFVKELQMEFPKVEILFGDNGLKKIASDKSNDIVLIAVTGLYGLIPAISAIESGIDIALANKETLVAAGSIVMEKAKKHNVKIFPVDSEHSAIYQCMTPKQREIRKIILTASGGPFRTSSLEEIEQASVESALAHPNWSMGSKITVDSATLMNKGLEVIEAHWLFGIDYKKIEVIIHPQSIIHGLVEFSDGSMLSQMGLPSMHIPIQYALTCPESVEGLKTGTLDLTQISRLDFEPPDFQRFPCLKLAYQAGEKGGTYPTVLNAINEEAVYAFLDSKIKLNDIYRIVDKGLQEHDNICNPSLEQIIDTDRSARLLAKKYINLKTV